MGEEVAPPFACIPLSGAEADLLCSKPVLETTSSYSFGCTIEQVRCNLEVKFGLKKSALKIKFIGRGKKMLFGNTEGK